MNLLKQFRVFLFSEKYATKPIAVFIILFTTFFTAISQILFKMSSVSLSEGMLSLILNKYFIIGFCLYGFCYVMYLFALKFGELSVINPLLTLTAIYSIFFSYFYLHEVVGNRLFPIIILLVGVLFITRPVEVRK